jgi:hypothetical protein
MPQDLGATWVVASKYGVKPILVLSCLPDWSAPRVSGSSPSTSTLLIRSHPRASGRVVAALAADDNVMALTGRPLTVEDLARMYAIDPTT